MERSSTHKMFFRREEKKLARVQRALSRKKKGSANRQKAKRKVNTVHYRIKCRRKNYAHRTTTSIAKRVRFIGVESLNIAGMMKDRRQAKSVAAQATGQFLELLPYKVEARGREVFPADHFFASSQQCSTPGCDGKKKMPRGVQTYRCEKCGIVMDRNLNAAINLRMVTVEELRRRGHCRTHPPESGEYACGDTAVGEAGNCLLVGASRPPRPD